MRRLLLELGADLLGGGMAVHEVEQSLRDLGAALGAPDVCVAAVPTGLFVALGPDQATAYRSVGPALRFEQTADVLDLENRLRTGALDVHDAMGALTAIRRTPARWPAWVSDLGVVPIGAGLCLLLQPALPNIIAALLGSLIVAGLLALTRHWPPLRPLLPVSAGFTVSLLVLAAAQASLLDGSLRTIVAILAVLLPGSLLVTGLSEIAAGAITAGTSRLMSGTVQLVLFLTGITVAAAIIHAPSHDLSNQLVAHAGWWAPWTGLALAVLGIVINVNTPLRATPHIAAVVAVTAAVQLPVQTAWGPAAGGLTAAIAASTAATVVHWLPGGPSWQVAYLPAFWIVVPGSFGLLSTAQLTTGNATHSLITAVSAVIAVSVGTLIGSVISHTPRPTRHQLSPH
ncbi:threonine/serine exporter family protein [Streptomyces sp. V3I7]|uniref:threonine/serine exporter family protein n=1 Tax=Streptomyces sp. V3I7 TaxID=3042278 RepID=UPI00278654AD|nr:threonine/serine exporter family protein [Streptomyces sp. V3I7]MDQ0993556.1 uncharacterized membrane protein YjjP (DUF1212 family) [Streptomyces sp. V3I7]